MKKIIKYSSIVIVIIWLGIVFILSSESGIKSENTSSNFTKIIFMNNITDEKVENLTFIIRKFAHFSLYVFGGISICVCMKMNLKSTSNVFLISYIIGTLYAITDELHQLIIPGRSCEIRDVIIDSVGVLCGVGIVKIGTFGIKKLKIKRSD